MIAGPHVYICDRCILDATAAFLEEPVGTAGTFCLPSEPAQNCGFCSKGPDEVWKILSKSGHNVCSECIEVCLAIMQDDVLTDAAAAEQMSRLEEQNRRSEKPARSLWKRFFHA